MNRHQSGSLPGVKPPRRPLSRADFLRTEIIAGLTTFCTMSYIVVVNPAILSSPGTGLDFNAVMTATVSLCFVTTLLMALYARLPYVVAPGMGINAFFTYSVIINQHVPARTALGMVAWSGILFLVVSLTPLREHIARSIPKNIRIAAATGIGIFLTFIGLKDAGIIAADPENFVKLAHFSVQTYLSICGLFVMLWFLLRRSPLTFLVGILVTTAIGGCLGLVKIPQQWTSWPDFSLLGTFDMKGSLQLSLLPTIVSLMFTDFFDSISTFVGVAHANQLLDENGEPRRLRQGLIVDAWATFLAGVFGTSSGTAYLESSAGIEVGGRTGWTSLTTALCFLPCYFLAPLAGFIPAYAISPVLILIGALMFRSVRELELGKMEEVLPSFLTITLIPLTFSITQGILWGFVSHVMAFTLAKRVREITPTLWILSSVCLALLILNGSR